ncbi:MAG: hypothetical protein ACRDHD_06880 [Candidatus Limnocylindria bacterium]
MKRNATGNEPAIARRVFGAWSITIPASFAETFVDEGGYWHAYDTHRSVSLTSMVVEAEGGPVSADRILRQMGPLPGASVDSLPPGLIGYGVEDEAIQPARASRTLSGILVRDGRVLMVTITGDDTDWARRTWLSIGAHPAPLPGPGQRGQEEPNRIQQRH